MGKKLLVVHPQTRYDTMHLTRAAIIAHVTQYDERDIFVILNRAEAFTYLRKSDTLQHQRSSLGEMHEDFTRQILADCTELTIVGHTGTLCHHTAFETVLKSFAHSPATALTITLPKEAISRPCEDTGESMQFEIDLLAERRIAPGWLPHRLSLYHMYLHRQYSRIETATLFMFQEYIASAFFVCSTLADTMIYIGEKVVGHAQRTGKNLRIVIT